MADHRVVPGQEHAREKYRPDGIHGLIISVGLVALGYVVYVQGAAGAWLAIGVGLVATVTWRVQEHRLLKLRRERALEPPHRWRYASVLLLGFVSGLAAFAAAAVAYRLSLGRWLPTLAEAASQFPALALQLVAACLGGALVVMGGRVRHALIVYGTLYLALLGLLAGSLAADALP